MLERKFGPLNDEARMRINGADAETLLAWGERVSMATCVERVFHS